MCEYIRVIDTGEKAEQVCKYEGSCEFKSNDVVMDLFQNATWPLCTRGDLK